MFSLSASPASRYTAASPLSPRSACRTRSRCPLCLFQTLLSWLLGVPSLPLNPTLSSSPLPPAATTLTHADPLTLAPRLPAGTAGPAVAPRPTTAASSIPASTASFFSTSAARESRRPTQTSRYTFEGAGSKGHHCQPSGQSDVREVAAVSPPQPQRTIFPYPG